MMLRGMGGKANGLGKARNSKKSIRIDWISKSLLLNLVSLGKPKTK